MRKHNELALGHFKELVISDNPRSVIILVHLMAEHYVNKLIEAKALNPKEIRSDSKTYTFAVKLALVYNMKLIPKRLYENIRRLNRLRNAVAHNLTVEFGQEELNYYLPDDKDKQELADLRAKIGTSSWDPNMLLEVVYLIGTATFVWLDEHCAQEHGMHFDYKKHGKGGCHSK